METPRMNFKFKLGDFIVPIIPQERDSPTGPSKVIALQLRGYIQIQPLGTTRRIVVKAEDYERCEEEIIEPDGTPIAYPPGWGIKTL